MRDFGQLEYVRVSGLCVAREENQHVPIGWPLWPMDHWPNYFAFDKCKGSCGPNLMIPFLLKREYSVFVRSGRSNYHIW